MQRIDNRTVELTKSELNAEALFEKLLDQGHGIVYAADSVATWYPHISVEFIDYLKDPK